MNFSLDSYETVDQRLTRYWKTHPAGRIHTELVHLITNTDGAPTAVLFRADVYRDATDPDPAAVGYAHEVAGSSPVNRTSWIENAETSAIGRALANLGLSKQGARPSREEMATATAHADNLITDQQMRHLGALLGQLEQARNVKLDRDARRAVIAELAGLDPATVQTANLLTSAQAATAIAALTEEIGA